MTRGALRSVSPAPGASPVLGAVVSQTPAPTTTSVTTSTSSATTAAVATTSTQLNVLRDALLNAVSQRDASTTTTTTPPPPMTTTSTNRTSSSAAAESDGQLQALLLTTLAKVEEIAAQQVHLEQLVTMRIYDHRRFEKGVDRPGERFQRFEIGPISQRVQGFGERGPLRGV